MDSQRKISQQPIVHSSLYLPQDRKRARERKKQWDRQGERRNGTGRERGEIGQAERERRNGTGRERG
jgi:hypothetical protein